MAKYQRMIFKKDLIKFVFFMTYDYKINTALDLSKINRIIERLKALFRWRRALYISV